MNPTATILHDEAYYRETYAQWLRHVSRFRRWQFLVGAAALVAGVMVFMAVRAGGGMASGISQSV